MPTKKPRTEAPAKRTKSIRKAVKAVAAKYSLQSMRDDPAVVAFIEKLKLPMRKQVEAVRVIIRGVSPTITEGIKWNAPSFRIDDDFATMNLRAKDGEQRLWLILHTGAKVKAGAKVGLVIDDPEGLLEWLAKDRAVITLSSEADIAAKRSPLRNIIKQWIRHI